MKKRAARKLIASLSILAYVGMGSGFADQFVYCVGPDGHSAVERVHVATGCLTETQDTSQRASAEATTTAACTDMPLLVPAPNEQEKISQVFTAPSLHVSYPLYQATAPAPRADATVACEPHDHGSASRSTTVLRV